MPSRAGTHSRSRGTARSREPLSRATRNPTRAAGKRAPTWGETCRHCCMTALSSPPPRSTTS